MVKVNDKVKSLYDTLVKDGYDLGSYDKFTKNVQDSTKRQSLYDAITKDGYDVGDFSSFTNNIIPAQTEPKDAPIVADADTIKVDNVVPAAEGAKIEREPEQFSMNENVKDYVLSHKPDMFRSKGTNLSTHPLGINEDSLQGRYRVAESRAKDKDYLKAVNEGQIESVQNMIDDARKLRSEERRQIANSLKDKGQFNVYSQAYIVGQINDTDRQLEFASTLLDEARNINEQAKEGKKRNWLSNFAKGVADTPLDVWSMGLQDLSNMSAANKVIKKVESGAELSPSEDALMQAMVVNAASKMYNQEDLGRAYKIGGITGNSLPFMLDMITGMAAVQGATKPASRALVKYATQKLRDMGVKSGAKRMALGRGAAHAANIIKDTGLHTATFGSQRVAAEYEKRRLGQTEVNLDASGDAMYSGQSGQEEGAKALGKAIVSTAAETGSELVGEYFSPMLGAVSRTLGLNKIGKIMPSSIGKLSKEIVGSQAFKDAKKFADAAKITDPFGEYGEEVLNNLISVGIGDMSVDELVDLDNNIDTFLGVAPMSVLFGGMGTGNYIRQKYKLHKDIKGFEKHMEEEYGEDWTDLRNALQSSTIEEARGFVKDVLSRNDLSKSEKADMVRYVYANLQEQTLNSADLTINLEDIEANKREIFNDYKLAAKRASFLDDNDKAKLVNMSVEDIEALPIGDNEKQRIVDYKAASEAYDLYINTVKQRVERARSEAIAQVESLTNQTTGTVMRVQSGFSEKPVYILRGNVAFESDGSVDSSKSDSTVYYLDEEGKVKMGSINMIKSLIDDTDAATMAEDAANDAQVDVESQETSEVSPVSTGTTFESNGISYEVGPMLPDGTYQVYISDGNGVQAVLMSESEIAEVMLNKAVSEADKEEQIDNMSEIEQGNELTPQAKESNVPNSGADTMSKEQFMETLPKDKDGQIDYDAMTPEQAYQFTAYDDADMALVDLASDINTIQKEVSKLEIQASNATGGKRLRLISQIAEKKEQLKRLQDFHASVSPQQVATEESANEEPIVEKSAPVPYEDMDSYDTIADLNHNLSNEEVDAFVANNIKKHENEVKEIDKKAPKIGTDMQSYLAEKAKWQAERDELQRKADYWKGIASEVEDSRKEIGEDEAKQILSMSEPTNSEEFAAMVLGSGDVKLNRESYLRETGFGASEAKKMFGLFSRDGVTIEQAGEIIERMSREEGYNFFQEGDTNAGRDAVLNVLSQSHTRGDLINYVKRAREREAEEIQKAIREQYESDIEKNFHISVQEYEDMVEAEERELGRNAMSEEDYNEFMSALSDEYYNNNEGTSNESNTSDEVLQEGESNQPEGTGATEIESEKTDGRSDNEGKTSQIEEPSEVEEQQPTEANGSHKIQVKAKNAYDSKDDLKKNGFAWNKEAKTWDKEFASMEEYNAFLEHFMNVSYYGRRVVNRYHSQVDFEVVEAAEEEEDKQKQSTEKGSIINPKESIIDYIDRIAAQDEEKNSKAKKESSTPSYGSNNKVVSTERYEELRKKMRAKLNQLNSGYDPELVALGAEMAAYHVEAGARKFADFAKRMLVDMGEDIRPYLKLFYNSVRDFPGMESFEAEMTPYDEVKATDINSIKLDEQDAQLKPESELSGNSAEYPKREVQEKEAVNKIGAMIRDKAISHIEGKTVEPLSMKDIKKLLSEYDMLSEMSATDMQELVELAMTNETRETALKYINSDNQKYGYDLVLAMYNMQPLLNARDSTRFERQQYSTPTPFGYVMGQFVHADKEVNSVLEPSAGNGALTITFPSEMVHVNDIDERRLENLRTLGYGNVTNQDALLPFEDNVDVVITNPPFGNTTTKEFDDGQIKINSLEGLMAINALESMKDDGRAAIVIGGNTSYRDNGAMQNKDMRLFAYLYSHYNVVDVINLDGEMYKRNGTKYDVRIILINGRKPNASKIIAPPVKSKARAEQVKSFDELYNRIQDDIHRIHEMDTVTPGAEEISKSSDSTRGRENSNVSNRSNDGERTRPDTDNKGVGLEDNMVGTETVTTESNERKGKENAEGLDNVNRPDEGSTGNVPSREQVAERNGSTESTDGRAARPDATNRGDNASGSRLAVNLVDEKVSYPNRSQSSTLMSVVPANQAQVLANSLANIGDVDQFLVDELGYSSKDELFSYLAAEQIDSVSLAINQMNNGNGFIIGDMTGVGKGRQGAALIRYAVRKGYKPIYFTQKPALFSDNYRDLSDIGSGELRPFIIGSDPKNAVITDASGNVIHKLPSEKEKNRVYDYILKNGTLPEEYDYVIVTYSQINNGTKEYETNESGIVPKDKSYNKKSPSAADKSGQKRRDVLEALSKDNIMILDESHTAGGKGGGSMFMQYIMSGVKGVTFLSATFAKRADNMPIYAMKTDLAKSGISQQELIEAIGQGGVTLQEIMSKQLVQSGQMIRRERSFNGVTIDWLSVSEEEDAVQRKQFDEVSSIFSDIRAFQKEYITPLVENRSEELAEEGGYSDLQKGTSELGVTNTPFASKMYNLVNQLLFSLKADAVANRVIENLKNGFKPVISFTNTMEGFLDEAPKDIPMDKVPNFSLTLQKALDGVMRYTETGLNGEKENKHYSPSELGELGEKAYYEIKNKIEHLSVNLPISPMDAIKNKIEEAGYKVGEITGRNLEMSRNEDGKYVVRNRKDKDKKSAARDFNNGKLDVLMINKSGSTGISLHSSPKFEDQRQRVMVFAQFQSDINDEVQMRGRIDRTGQIYRGKYEYIMSSIPAEQRLQMMFKAKLKSLDANTTSSQKSKFNEMQVTDYLNKYGDEVTWQYMVEHPELSEKLGDPLNLLGNEKEYNEGEVSNELIKDSAAKIARYLPFLSVKEQEEVFKEITDAYAVKIQLLNDAGENDLEITTMPLKAKTLSRKVWKPGVDPNSGNAFADNTYIEEVEVDVLKKPMKSVEVKKNVERLSDGLPYNEWRENKEREINEIYQSKVESLKEKLKKSAEDKIEKAIASYTKKAKDARAKGKNEFSDEEIDRMAQTLADGIKEKANEGYLKQKNAIEARRDNVLRILRNFEPLEPLIIPINLEEETATIEPIKGTFLGFKFSKDYSPSSSTAVFATLDGRRKIEIPIKNNKAFNTIRMNTLMQPTYLKSLNIDTWDSYVPTQSRKKAYIVTGNLLQALVDVKKSDDARGYLVSYSTIDGDTKQGILMSDGFKPDVLTTSVPISSKMEQVKQGQTVVSEDKRVVVEKNVSWRGGFVIKVPKSKKQGGEFFEDKTLRSLVKDNEFITKGNFMVAELDDSNLPKALDRLSNMGVKVSSKAKLKDVDAEGDTRFRDVTGQEDFNELNYSASSTASSLGVPITTHTSLDTVPEGAAKIAIEKGHKVKGWYDVKSGTIHVYMPNATSEEDVSRTILHEWVAHYGLRKLVGEENFDSFLDEVFANVSNEVRQKILSTLNKYNYNPRVATEEYMASIAEGGVEQTVWNRIKQAIKYLLRKIGFNVPISDNEIKYILWRSAQNLKMDNPLDLAKDVAMQANLGVGNYSQDNDFDPNDPGARHRVESSSNDSLFRVLDESDGSIDEYNEAFNSAKYWAKEAWQDSMLALKKLQDVVAKVSGKKIETFEDAYLSENQLSRINRSQSIKYWKEYMQPITDAISRLTREGVAYEDIKDYVMLVHGIERNAEMSMRKRIEDDYRKAIKAANGDKNEIEKAKREREDAYSNFSAAVSVMRKKQGYEYLKDLSDYVGEVGDYSATQAILSKDGGKHDDFQYDALDRVNEFEDNHVTSDLWDAVNDATKESLRKTFESGMSSRNAYDRVRTMFKYYVPLRGWEQTRAEDVYDYMSDINPVNSVMKKMEGRKSIPDDPFATIGSMGESAIIQGNRNRMKIKFFNMALNHPTDLVTTTNAWYVPDIYGDMVISLPDIDESDSSEEISEKIKQHNELMQNTPGAVKNKDGLNIKYPSSKGVKSQHSVIVTVNGRDYILYVNGNPRAAQALNGLTNPDAETNPALKQIYWINRQLSSLYTSRNPEFVPANMVRDLIEATVVVKTKEDKDYKKTFDKNLKKSFKVVAQGLKDPKKAKGREGDYFREFIDNGGEMGYMTLSSVNDYKKKIKKELDEISGNRGSAKKALDYVVNRVEDFNRYAESISRFAVYMTSREQGRDIETSIKDASDVTVNFSKKGSGFMAMGGKMMKNGGISTFAPKFFGTSAGMAKMLYLFINPAVQSLANWGRIAKQNKGKVFGAMAGFTAMGVLVPIINNALAAMMGDDDDKDSYNDLPEWVRRNNFCIYAGGGKYVTIPLPHTLRAFYGIGEMSYQLATGNKKITLEKAALEIAGQISALLPIDPLGNNMDIRKTLTPSAFRGTTEAYVMNEDFMGNPIAKETPFNEKDPEWKRVYKGTSGWLVDTSKFFNDLTAGEEAGRDFRKGLIDFNPAKIEHMGESYFGGLWKTANKLGKTLYYAGKSAKENKKDENLVLRNVPIVRRFLSESDERNSFSSINERYYDLVNEMEQYKYELDGVKKSIRNDLEKYGPQYETLSTKKEREKYEIYKGYKEVLDILYQVSKEVEGDERKDIEKRILDIRKDLLEEVEHE